MRRYRQWVTIRCFINDHPAGEVYGQFPVYRGRKSNRPYVLYRGYKLRLVEGVAEMRVNMQGLEFQSCQ